MSKRNQSGRKDAGPPAGLISSSPTPSAAGQDQRSTLNAQPSTILLAVTGMSPAILTETIWALAHEAEPVLPARVIVLTTVEGRRQVTEQLLGRSPRFGGLSPWEALRAALAAEGFDLTDRLRFGSTPDDIRVFTATDGGNLSRELPDIRTPSDNEAAADFLLEQVRGIVENPDTRLVASLAGGRKTMGALLYACLTLAGRETDRLTHVLVNEPFEALREFWFPGQPGGAIAARAGTAHAPGEARVDLADVPFVPLRNLFQRELGRKAGTFSRLVESCRQNIRQRAAEALRLTVETTRTEIEINGERVKLAPTEHLVLLFLALRAKQGEPAFAAYKDAVDDLNAFRAQQVQEQKSSADWRHADSLRALWEEREITKAVSGLREKLRRRGGSAATLANCLPEKGRCSLEMIGALIFIQ